MHCTFTINVAHKKNIEEIKKMACKNCKVCVDLKKMRDDNRQKIEEEQKRQQK